MNVPNLLTLLRIFFVPMLVAAGWVTEAERSPCLAYCQQWSTYLQAQECLTRDGLLVTGSTGTTVAHPASWVSKNALALR